MNVKPEVSVTTDPRDAAIEALEDRVRELEIEAEYAWSLVQCYKCQEQTP